MSAGRPPGRCTPIWHWPPWKQAIFGRSRKGELTDLIDHSDRGLQYLSIRYTERVAQAGAVTSVGSRGDSYDNALAESVIGLCKTELIRDQGLWKGIDQVEYATLEWVDWWDHRRLLTQSRVIPPAEKEVLYYVKPPPARNRYTHHRVSMKTRVVHEAGPGVRRYPSDPPLGKAGKDQVHA